MEPDIQFERLLEPTDEEVLGDVLIVLVVPVVDVVCAMAMPSSGSAPMNAVAVANL